MRAALHAIDMIMMYVLFPGLFIGSFIGIILATMGWRKQWEAGLRRADRKYADRQYAERQRRERDA
jgi:hypothetical protein